MAISDENQCRIEGRLTREPSLKYIPSGEAVCELSIASNQHWQSKASGEEKTRVLYLDVKTWGKSAEACKQFLHKGSHVTVNGQLEMDVSEKDGNKRTFYSLRANNGPHGVRFLDPRPKQEEAAAQAPTPEKDDDIPF